MLRPITRRINPRTLSPNLYPNGIGTPSSFLPLRSNFFPCQYAHPVMACADGGHLIWKRRRRNSQSNHTTTQIPSQGLLLVAWFPNTEPYGVKNLMNIVAMRIRFQGFIQGDLREQYWNVRPPKLRLSGIPSVVIGLRLTNRTFWGMWKSGSAKVKLLTKRTLWMDSRMRFKDSLECWRGRILVKRL